MSSLDGDAAGSERAEKVDNMESAAKLHLDDTDTITEAAVIAADRALSRVDAIVETETADEASVLRGLTEGVRNQDDLQRDITYQAKLILIEQEDGRDKKRLEKAKSNKDKLLAQKRTLVRRLTVGTPAQTIRTAISGSNSIRSPVPREAASAGSRG